MIKFENVLTSLRNKYVLAAIGVILAGLSIYAFKANWGVDYADADLYILHNTDNSEISTMVQAQAQTLPQLSRIEKVNQQDLYIYVQNSSDNIANDITKFASANGLTFVGNYAYKFSREEFRLLLNRIITFASVVLVVAFVYYGADLRNKDWKRWQVGYYIFNEILIGAATTIILFGLASILGQAGVKMDNDFTNFMGIALSIGMLYRLYEIEVIKRIVLNTGKTINYDQINTIFKSRRPELILLSCVLSLVGFMPFVVISWHFASLAILILGSIIINYWFAGFIKPGLLAFVLQLGEKSKFLQRPAFQKPW